MQYVNLGTIGLKVSRLVSADDLRLDELAAVGAEKKKAAVHSRALERASISSTQQTCIHLV